jgi:cytochrome c
MSFTKGLPIALAAAAAVAAASGWSAAQDGAGSDIQALLRAKGCHACHALSEPLLGPPYQAIALQNAADHDAAVERLAQKILAGGAGSWGVVPMPRNDRVSPEEARIMAAWILEQSPQ